METIRITITGEEGQRAEFRDVVNFLWDLNLLYEITRLALDPEYRVFKVTPRIFQRNGRPLRHGDRLQLARLSKESPLSIQLILAALPIAASTLWIFVQTAQKLQNWRIDRTKLEVDLRKAQLEVQALEDRRYPPTLVAPPEVELLESDGGRGVRKEPSKESLRVWKPSSTLRKMNRRIRLREAEEEVEAVTKRLEKSPVAVTDVQIELISE